MTDQKDRNFIWAEYNNKVFDPAPANGKQNQIKKLITALWQMHGKEFSAIKDHIQNLEKS